MCLRWRLQVPIFPADRNAFCVLRGKCCISCSLISLVPAHLTELHAAWAVT